MSKITLRISYTLEKADHDGYCSGEECSYQKEISEFDFSLYQHQIKYDDDKKIDLQSLKNTIMPVLDKYIRLPGSNGVLSLYCDITQEYINKEVDCHEYYFYIFYQ